MSLARAANIAWVSANALAYWRYRAALQDPQHVQEAILRKYLRINAETAFGRAHGFASIGSMAEYQRRVPLSPWSDFVPWVQRIAAGEAAVLTDAPVRVLQATGGSSGVKHIPYTAELQRELRRAVGPWIVDLCRRDPGLLSGRGYWAITPVALPLHGEASRVRVGFETDAEYLGGAWRRLVDATLAVPDVVRLIPDVESFRYVTLLFLLRARDLVLISVWHPSFLTLLLEALPRHWETLVEDLARGSLRPPGEMPPAVHRALVHHLRPAPRRSAELRRLGLHHPTQLWPSLRLVSCWGDGHAALHARALQRRLPRVALQPKGLLATEACVTLPFYGETPLAVRSHFFEFLEDGQARLAHQLAPGGVYSVVVTTGGGLYRYCLEDRVQVARFLGRTPVLHFLGKSGHVSDLVGEKLHEEFVANAVARVLECVGLESRFALLAPDLTPPQPGYTFYVECAAPPHGGTAFVLEQVLQEHPDYRYAVNLGQLRSVRVFRIRGGGLPIYLERCQERGQRLGDVKPLALSPVPGWSSVFPGCYEQVCCDRAPRTGLPSASS